MSEPPRAPREIDGKGRTVRESLSGRNYSFDYYQREYKRQQKQLAEPIDALAAKFFAYPLLAERIWILSGFLRSSRNDR